MKLNLGCGSDIRNGYINIDRLPPGQVAPDVYRQGDIQTLDWITEDGTVEEILALDCLEYLPTNVIQLALKNWASKLVSGGTMKILVPDCHAIAKSFANGQFSLAEYSQMTFGTQNGNDNRMSMIDVVTLLDILESIPGLIVSTKRYEGVAIYVEVIK
jgi:predicted SAM-dependent methyltransferase